MSDYRPTLKRAQGRFSAPEMPLEGVFRRRDRRRRNQRIRAGAMGIAVAVLAIAFGRSIVSSHERPADHGRHPRGTLHSGIFRLDGSLETEIYGLPADAFGTRLSPDGRSVVFITRDVGFAPCATCIGSRPRLATMRLDGSRARVLTGRWRSVDMPVWSPDGTKIAFQAVRANGTDSGNADIYEIGADGSGLLRLTNGAVDGYPSWSPDGSHVIYDNAGRIPLDDMDLSATQEIWSVPAGGGVPVQVTHDGLPEKQAAFSPDGSQIAVSRGPDGLWLLDANGGNARRIADFGALFSPRWSPDGTRIAFLSYQTDFRPWVLDPRTGGTARRASLPLLKVNILDLSTGKITTLPIQTASDVNGTSWLPDGRAFLIDRYVGQTATEP